MLARVLGLRPGGIQMKGKLENAPGWLLHLLDY